MVHFFLVISIGDTNECQIKDGSVSMLYGKCPDQVCVHSAAISKNGQTIICMPNRVVLEIIDSDTDDQDALMCVVSVKDKAVITSGGYERYFTDEETGKTWHHILDPKTGYSAESGLISVTIVSEKGILADGLSTAVFIMGLDKSIDYWREHQDLFDMILVTETREIYITEGLKESVSCDYSFHTIFADE